MPDNDHAALIAEAKDWLSVPLNGVGVDGRLIGRLADALSALVEENERLKRDPKLFEHMLEVAKANGFDSLTDAITKAVALRLRVGQQNEALKSALLVMAHWPRENLNASFQKDIDFALDGVRQALSAEKQEG